MSNARDKANIPALNFSSTGIDDNATSTAITIDSSQFVGIGQTTPLHKLEVKDGEFAVRQTDSSAAPSIKVINDVALQAYLRGAGTTRTNPGTAQGMPQLVSLSGYDLFISTDGNNNIPFTTNRSEKMRLTSDGNLLLNTTSQISGATFSVLGSIGLDRTSTYNQQWLQSITHSGTSDYGTLYIKPQNGQSTAGLRILDASGNTRFAVRGLGDSNESVFNYNGADINFRVRSNNNVNMLFVDGGTDRVGIGTSSPSQALDVNGTVKATAFQGDGSALTNLPGGGKVLQVLQTVKTDTFSTTTTAPSYSDITGLSVSITPSASNSKILVMVSLTATAILENIFASFKLVRGSTDVFLGDSRGSTTRASSGEHMSGGGNYTHDVSFTFLDSPNTTSSTTYKVQGNTRNNTLFIGGSYYTSNSFNTSTPCSITAMEIGA